MLGLESAIAGSWASEKPERMSVAEAKRLVDDDAGFDRMVGLGVITLDGDEATVVRPKLIEAFNEIRQFGVGTNNLIDIHEQTAPLIDEISAILVRAGVEHVLTRINPGAALPPDTEVAELITMLVRFRTQAVAAVSATLAFSIESTIESWSVRSSANSSRSPKTSHREQTHEGLDRPLSGPSMSARGRNYSHSMVPGGLLVTSSTTRFTSGTSLVIRVEIRSRTS